MILRNGIVQFALLIQRVSKKEVRLGKSRRVTQGSLVMLHRFVQLALLGEQAAQDRVAAPRIAGNGERMAVVRRNDDLVGGLLLLGCVCLQHPTQPWLSDMHRLCRTIPLLMRSPISQTSIINKPINGR